MALEEERVQRILQRFQVSLISLMDLFIWVLMQDSSVRVLFLLLYFCAKTRSAASFSSFFSPMFLIPFSSSSLGLLTEPVLSATLLSSCPEMLQSWWMPSTPRTRPGSQRGSVKAEPSQDQTALRRSSFLPLPSPKFRITEY